MLKIHRLHLLHPLFLPLSRYMRVRINAWSPYTLGVCCADGHLGVESLYGPNKFPGKPPP